MEHGILSGAGDSEEACSDCGMTRRSLYADGRMGCARCYEVFAAEVEQALIEIHGKSVHIGKVWEAPSTDDFSGPGVAGLGG